MRRVAPGFVAGLGVIVALALFVTLAAVGVIPIEGLFLFLVSNVLVFVLLLVFAALGGAFVGMLVAHRIVSSRQFSPLERSLVEALATLKDVREGQVRIDERLAALEQEWKKAR